jgi:hypothetical protein
MEIKSNKQSFHIITNYFPDLSESGRNFENIVDCQELIWYGKIKSKNFKI